MPWKTLLAGKMKKNFYSEDLVDSEVILKDLI